MVYTYKAETKKGQEFHAKNKNVANNHSYVATPAIANYGANNNNNQIKHYHNDNKSDNNNNNNATTTTATITATLGPERLLASQQQQHITVKSVKFAYTTYV